MNSVHLSSILPGQVIDSVECDSYLRSKRSQVRILPGVPPSLVKSITSKISHQVNSAPEPLPGLNSVHLTSAPEVFAK